MKKFHLIYGFFCLVAAAMMLYSLSAPASSGSPEDNGATSQYVKGRIIQTEDGYYAVRLSDERNSIVQTQLDERYMNDDYQAGDSVTIYVSSNEEGKAQYDIADFYHYDGLIMVFLIFCAMALLVARRKGFYSILSVVISLVLFYAIVLKAVQLGVSILLAGIVYVLLITILTIPLIHGFNKKGLSAIIAVNIGYLCGLLLTYLFTAMVRIGRTPAEEFRILLFQYPDINIEQVLMVSLFLGVVGALIDVSVSICSAIFEGMKEHPGLTFQKTYTLGMSVGKDILGSMINTLLLAYLAASLPFLILMTLARYNNMVEFLNYDFIALELTRIFIGAAAIVLLIPITSVSAAYLVMKKGLLK